jgi:hypothetical protein
MYKITLTVPISHADAVRRAVGDAGGGKDGNYTHCSFSVAGKGRFLPNKNARPFIGSVSVLEEVDEEKIEFVCGHDVVKEVVAAMLKAHPYEQVAYDISPLFRLEDL